MKLIYKTRNLALTALFGAALALGTPVALAQNVDENVEPAPDQQEPASYEGDVALIKQLTEFVETQKDNCKETDPEAYATLAQEYDRILSYLAESLVEVNQANKDAEESGEAYESPLSEGFSEEVMEMVGDMANNLVYAQVAQAMDKVEALGSSLLAKVDQLRGVFEETVKEEVGEDAESFFLNEEGSDKILAELDAMRVEISKAADAAEALDNEKFVSPVTEEWIAEMNGQIDAFYEVGDTRIKKAEANLQVHDGNVENVQALDSKLAEAFNAVVEHAQAVLGEEIEWTDEEEDFFKDEPDYDKAAALLEAFHKAIADAAGTAQEDNWQSYDDKVGEGAHEVELAIQQYQDDAEYLANNAQAQLQLFQEDVDRLDEVEKSLADAFEAVVANINEKLGEDFITDENEAFFVGEKHFQQVQAEIETVRALAVEAYEVAAADHWQKYESKVGENISSLDKQVLEYLEDTEYLADNAQANMQQHTEDVDYLMGLEEELANAAQAIADKYNETVGEDVELDEADQAIVINEAAFDAIQAKIEQYRKAVTEEYDKAEADNWQSYSQEATGLEEAAQGIYEEILAYQETGVNRVEKALATIAQHDADIEAVIGLESKLMEAVQGAQELYAEKLEEELGEPTDEAEAFFYDEADYDALQKAIDDLRTAIVEAYDASAAEGLEAYESPVTEEWTADFDAKLQEYADECEYRVNNALAQLQLHGEDADMIAEVGTKLADAFNSIVENLQSKLGEDELTEEQEAFFTGEVTYNEIAAKIEDLHAQVVEAYDKAAADNWQKYESPLTDNITPLDEAILAYLEDTEYLADNAQANMQQHNEDVEYLMGLEEELANAAQAIADKYNETVGEDLELDPEEEAIIINEAAFDAIQAKIEQYRKAVVAEATQAEENNWQSYSQEATGLEEAAQGIYEEILAYQEAGLNRVDLALATLAQHDADVAALMGVEGQLMSAIQDAQALYVEKLEPELGELTEEQEDFFYDQAGADAVQKLVDDARKAMVEAYDAALAAGLESYESPVTEEFKAKVEAELQAYIDTTEYRINNALAQLQLHDQDVEYIDALEGLLAEAATAVVEKFNSTIGEDIELSDEEISAITNERMFDAIQAEIEYLRMAVVAAYDKAAADNWQNYDQASTGLEDAIPEIQDEIVAYQENALKKVEKALEAINTHDANINTLGELETKLMAAVQAAQELYAEKLEEELGEADEAFFYDEEDFNAVQAAIDAEREAVAKAYEATVAGGYASYESPLTEEWLAEAQAKIQDYADECEYRVLNALAQLQLHDEDVELVQGLDSELFNAVVAAQTHVMELLGVEELTDAEEEFFLDEKTYEALSARIDALRQSVVAAYDAAAADNWQNYDQEASGVKEQAQELYEAIVKYQEQCEYLADNAQAQMQLHDEDVDMVQALDTELFNTVVGVQEMMQEKLGEEIEITDEMAAFFQDEDSFDALQAKIDDLRMSVVAAYDKAAENNWQNYDQDASGVKEHAQEVYDQIMEYKDECEYRVNNALANIQLHGEDAEMIFDLEAVLQAAFDEVATEADDNIDGDILEGIRDYLVVEGYEAVLEKIEALRKAMIDQYDVAAADNWQNYEQQVVPNASGVDEQIAQYKEESGSRVLKALASIEAHQYDLDVLLPLDEMLGDGIAELMEEHPELFEEGSEFIDQYEQLSGRIEEIWKEIAAAATEAEEDNWQSYNSVFANTDVTSLYNEVEDFLASAWGDLGTINLHRWEADNNEVIALESMLVSAVEYIQQNYPDFDVDPDFDAIQAAIDGLRHQMADAYEAADDVAWETYECPYTQNDLDAVEGMIEDMIAHAQGSSAIEGVNASDEQPMIFSIDGKRLNAPIKGELNIFIYKNRVEKKIVK